MNAGETQHRTSFWRSWTGLALCGFIAVGALALILEHRAHALQWLPFALLLACPLMHLFHGHGGHGGHHGHAQGAGEQEPQAPTHPGTRRQADGRSDDGATK